jgi:subtilisin family serine protease
VTRGATDAGRVSVGAIVAAVLIGAWTALVTAALPALAWVAEQLLLYEEITRPAWLWPLTGWLAALLAGVPAYLLVRLVRSPAIRAAGRAWLGAALLLGLLGSARALPTEWNEAYLALLAALALAAPTPLKLRPWAPMIRPTTLKLRRSWPAIAATPMKLRPLGLGVVAGLAVLLPWLVIGALGGLLESVLACLAAAATGRLAAVLLERTVWPAYRRAFLVGSRGTRRSKNTRSQGRTRLILLGGLVAGVALAPLAAAIGAAGPNLLAILVLPPLGFVAAALVAARHDDAREPAGAADRGPRWSVAAMLGLAATGPLAFVEPVQTTVLLGLQDIGFWALVAALTSLCVAVLLAIGYGLGARHQPSSAVAAVLVAILAAVDISGYVAFGHPGLYGDRLFVTLKARADLSGITSIRDLSARRTEVYRRLVEVADRSQNALRRDLSRLHLNYAPYYLVNGLEVDGGPAVRAWLASRPEVAQVLRSPRLRPVPERAGPLQGSTTRLDGPQWNARLIGADRVWASGDTGTGIVIGASDSGVDGTHPALSSGFRAGTDSWYDPWNGTRTPTDHSGHGTHTLGTAAGRDGIGVAPGAQWIGCVNLDRNLGNPAHYLDCLQYMLAPFPHGGDPLRDGNPARAADVLTNSWGCAALEGCGEATLRPAVDALTAAGIFVVAAAGNAGPRCGSISDPPAPYPDTLTVGAVDRARRLAAFSSRGPVPGASKPDLVAPGVDVLSSVPGGGYLRLTGTSMAAPHVAGVVALMWSANPALVGDVAATAAILRRTATPVRASGAAAGCAGGADSAGSAGVAGTGAGLVDAYAAVQAARAQ